MIKRLIPAVLDTAFVFTAAFAATFAVIRFYVKSVWVALVLAAVTGTLAAMLFRAVSKHKSAAYSLKTKDQELMENVLNELCLMSTEELTAFFTMLLDKMQEPYTIEDGHILLSRTNTVVRYYFTFSKAYEGKIIEFYKSTGKGKRLLVLGRSFSEETSALTDRFAGRIRLADGAALYLTMKRFELFPDVREELKTEKSPFNLPRALFSKKRAKQYFLYGLTLEFFSFFVYYPIYYVCFGTALILFSIVCFFFGLKDEPDTVNPFH